MSEYHIDEGLAYDMWRMLRDYPFTETRERAERVNYLMHEILDIIVRDNSYEWGMNLTNSD